MTTITTLLCQENNVTLLGHLLATMPNSGTPWQPNPPNVPGYAPCLLSLSQQGPLPPYSFRGNLRGNFSFFSAAPAALVRAIAVTCNGQLLAVRALASPIALTSRTLNLSLDLTTQAQN